MTDPTPSPPSPYEQGYRDALLSVRAMILAAGHTMSISGQVSDLIDRSNFDLWNLLALAQVDLSAYPEAAELRELLRAPNGVIIDSAGRMLFLRIQGTEYDTGVLGLQQEIARLSRQA